MKVIQAVRWTDDGGGVRIIDQRALPAAYVERDLLTVDDVCDAIATLAVRGAPAIGVAGAMGLVAALTAHVRAGAPAFAQRLAEYAARIRATRPTAVNLPWAIDRMRARARDAALGNDPALTLEALRAEATAILEEDRASCHAIGEHGLTLLPDPARVLTHCNAGALATAGIGTALAPVYLAMERGQRVSVLAGETRPLLQGSRLTAWELGCAGIDVTVLTDSMVASVMREGRVDLCIVGADRIAVNGDTANKIGTYAIAVLARHHDIPFYVAAPSSTFDPHASNGEAIEIESRHADEVRRPFGIQSAPLEANVHNPAFDITPANLITAYITDRGIAQPPFASSARATHAVSAR